MARKQNKFIESKDILSCMDKILSKSQYEVSRPGGYHETLYKMNDVLLEELEPYTSFLASQYKITLRQAFLFTVFVELGKGDSIGYSIHPYRNGSGFERDIELLQRRRNRL